MADRRDYIDAAGIRDPRLRFLWDEWNVQRTYEDVRPLEVPRLESLSRRANGAFTIAIGEWVLARFEGMDSDPEPLLFLEAAWAAVVDHRYTREIAIVDDEWRGPVRGPVSMALTFVLDSLFADEAGANSSFNTAWAATFARHVLPSSVAFDAWFEFCLTRLEALYPAPRPENLDWFEAENNWGSPVPAEAFDPDHRFDPGHAPAMIDRYLSRLQVASNPFLVAGPKMIDLGFKGTPYRYLPA